MPRDGSHSQSLLGEVKGSFSSVRSSSETGGMSWGWQVYIGCFALGESLCLPKDVLVIQHAGDWKLAWKNTRKKLRLLAGAFLGFTKLLPPRGNRY